MTFWKLSAAELDAPALVFGADSASAGAVTYGELRSRAEEFGSRLGHSSEKRLGAILCRNWPEVLCAYVAALGGGDAVMLLNEQTEDGLLQNIFEAYEPDWIFQPVRGPLPLGYCRGWQEHRWQLLQRTGLSSKGTLHSDLAVLLSTSGTTGSPKMVRLSHSNIAANAQSIVEYLSIGPLDRAVTSLPFNYSYGMSVVNSYLEAGATLVLTDSSMLTREFWDTFRCHAVTSLAGVPYNYEMLHRLNPCRLKLDSLKTLTQAGGRLAPRLIDYFRQISEEMGWRFFVMYGQTEAAPRISYVPPDMLAAKSGSIGIPIPGGCLSLSPDGELIYQGANVMMGYASCRDDLARGDELNGRLFTGDLATMDEDGYFYLHGRLKRFVKIHGNRVNLDDIEQGLEAQLHLPVAVVGEDDRLKVYLTTDADLKVAKDKLSTYHLHATTFVIRQIEVIPYTSSGKKDYAGISRS